MPSDSDKQAELLFVSSAEKMSNQRETPHVSQKRERKRVV